MRTCRILLGLSLLFAGCDHREKILVKSDMDGAPLHDLPNSAGTPKNRVDRFDDPDFVFPESTGSASTRPELTIDPFSVGASATGDAESSRVPDWERLSVLSLGVEAGGGDLDFARLSNEESRKPTKLQVELQAGLAAMNAGRFVESLVHFEAAQKADPRDFRAYFFDAVVQSQSNDLKARARAKASFDIAIRLAPQEAELNLHRGNFRLREGDYGGAVDDFTRVLQVQPKHLGALMNRAAANFHRRRPKDVVDDTTAIINLRSGVPDAHLLRALGLLMQGQTVLARRDFDAAVAAGLSKDAVESWKPYFRSRN